MLPWKLRKRQFLPVNQNLSSVHFSLAKFQLVSSNLSLATIWQTTHNHKLPKLCSATLNESVIFFVCLFFSNKVVQCRFLSFFLSFRFLFYVDTHALNANKRVSSLISLP